LRDGKLPGGCRFQTLPFPRNDGVLESRTAVSHSDRIKLWIATQEKLQGCGIELTAQQ
jgi:hypothetical protein